jgi:molybdate-binding protein
VSAKLLDAKGVLSVLPVDEVRHIEGIPEVRVLANAERLQVLRLLMRGPATLTHLGARLDRHPAWVRHHVLSLEHEGFVRLVETRPVKGYVEKYYAATARSYAVDFMVLPEPGESGLLVILGSDDMALDLLVRRLREDPSGPDVVTMAMGSLEGLIALRQGLGHVAGCHLLDPETGEFNRPFARAFFPGRELMMVTLAHRQQGLIVPAGNPRGLATMDDVAASGARLINRNRGSGTRVWLDRLLSAAGLTPSLVLGYEREVATHGQAAQAVADGAADVALGILPAARARGLQFVPLLEERFDLVMPRENFECELLAPLLSLLHDKELRRAVEALGGYETQEMGAAAALAG